MKLAEPIKAISFLKENAAEITRDFSENHSAPLIVTQNMTQNSKAKIVITDNDQKQRETMALLKILALGNKQIQEAQFQDADTFFVEMDEENQQ